MVVVLLLAVCVLLGAQCGTDDEVVKIMRDDFLSLAVSDAVRAATGLWADRLHWNVWIVPPPKTPSSAEYWKDIPFAAGKKTIIVWLNHPNGVDTNRYQETYSILEADAKGAVDGVLEQHGWQQHYLSYAYYVPRHTVK